MESSTYFRRFVRQLSPQLLIGLAAVAIVHAFALPESFWEFDEPLFAHAVWNYDPWIHHPPPPGYPVFIALAKLLNFFLHDPFVTLVTISYAAAILGFVGFSRAFAEISGDDTTGVIGAFLFYFSPTVLIHGTLPQSDSIALCFFAFTLWAGARALRDPRAQNTVGFGILAGLNVGVRPQFSIIVLPLLLMTLLLVRSWKGRLLIAGAFVAACLAWFVPMTAIIGGFDRMVEFELGQATYYATHDASISRGGWSAPKIAGRFIARPWGPVPFAAVVFALAIPGVLHLVRRRTREFAPLAAASAAYLAFALWSMDPADGARYALPSVVVVALIAGCGLVRLAWMGISRAGRNGEGTQGARRFATFGAALLAAGNLAYSSSIIAQRSREKSPPARAARWILDNVPAQSVILVELPLWPHATYWLKDFRIMKYGEGEQLFVRDRQAPVYVFADGTSRERDAMTFSWETSHAYRKLTRNHYRVVSVVPLGPEDRFQIVRGIHGSERDAQEGWRWLEPDAELVLPDIGATRVVLRFGLTRTAPIAHNHITVRLNGRPAAEFDVSRGVEKDVRLPLDRGENRLTIHARSSFVPGERGEGDPRRLAVRLMDLDQY